MMAYCPLTGKVLIDPILGTKYILQKVTGTCGSDFIYKASNYTIADAIDGQLHPSGYSTIKYIRRGKEADQSRDAKKSIPKANIIHVEKWYVHEFEQGWCVALPHMSEGSLRYILSARFHYGLPEDCIAIALKQALLGLFVLHNTGRVHKCFSAGNIYVNFKPPPVSKVEIKLGFAATIYESDLDLPVVVEIGKNHVPKLGLQVKSWPGGPSVPPLNLLSEWAAAPEVYHAKYYDPDGHLNPAQSSLLQDDDGYTVKSDIWLIGIAALELAYGNLRASHRKELEALIKKIKRSRTLPDKLEDVLEEINVKEEKGKMRKVVGYVKDKMKVVINKRGKKFSDDFEELVMDCLSSNASKRPSVQNLLQRPFFRFAKDLKYFQRRVLYAKSPMPFC